MSKRQRGPEEVELNLAAMLDMAFQILTFFVLTFRPGPHEAYIAARMPLPQSVVSSPTPTHVKPGDSHSDDPTVAYSTLAIWLNSSDDGQLSQIAVGTQTSHKNERREIGIDPKLIAFNTVLAEIVADPGNPFKQVVIQVGDHLRYDELMKVLAVCSRQFTGGDPHKVAVMSIVDTGDAK